MSIYTPPRLITQSNIDSLVVLWNELKQVATQMIARGTNAITVNDIERINGELSTNFTQYINAATALIDPADKDKNDAAEFLRQETNYKNTADSYERDEKKNTDQANIYKDKRYWDETTWQSNIVQTKKWWRGRRHNHYHYGTRDDGKYVTTTNSDQNAINNYNNYTNAATSARESKTENRGYQSTAETNKRTKLSNESTKRSQINTNYNNAVSIYREIYNKVSPQINSISTTGTTNAQTAGEIAASTVAIDINAYPQATSLNTQTLISTNQISSAEIISQQNSINQYNSTAQNEGNSTQARFDSASNAGTGTTLNSTAAALKTQAQDLALTAGQERAIQDEIDLRQQMRQSTDIFKTRYINDRLATITNNFISFYNSLTNKENANLTELNTQIPQATSPEPINSNTLAIDAAKCQEVINKDITGKYQFVNFKIDAAVSYPLKCIGTNEYSNAPLINMTPLDNNAHTFDTCRISSNLAKKPYYALVKPTNASNYNCYVTDSMPMQNTTSYDYVTIWEHGPRNSKPSVSKFSLSATGDFIITYGDNTTANISNITTGIYSGRIFELILTDTGNIEIRGYTADGNYNVVWESFSIPEVRANILDLIYYTSMSNDNWRTMNAQYKLNTQTSSSQLLVSQNNKFKLEVTTDGNLQLKTAVYGCKYTDPVNGNVNLSNTNFLYTDAVNSSVKGQPYYVYANDSRLPAIQTPYYAKNALGDKSLQPVSWSHPALANTSSYDTYPSIGIVNEGGEMPYNEDTQNGISQTACQENCNSDPTCNYFFYNKDQQSCYIGKNNIPEYIPNKNSDLYIRKKKMIITDSCNNTVPEFRNITSYSEYKNYATYKYINDPITSSDFIPGPSSQDKYKYCGNITDSTIHGTSAIAGFTTFTEGYDNHNYEATLDKYCIRGNDLSMGCHTAILQKQIAPLEQIARDYQNQTAQMNINRSTIGQTINDYKTIYDTLNQNNKYDFSGNQQFTMEDASIQTAMQQDTKQLLLQENDFYIAGSVLTATLLIGAIYLAR